MGIWLFFAVLGVMIALFLTEKLPIDLTAVLGLLVLVLGGYLGPQEAFAGFASPTVVVLISTFFVSAALMRTGAAESLAERIAVWIGPHEKLNILAVMCLAAVLSAFMNDVAAAAVLMPAVAGIAGHNRISPSRLFIPLAFGTILGGMTTLIGTPPNMLANDALHAAGLERFNFLDFLPIGLPIAVAGIAAAVLTARYLLPVRDVRPRMRLKAGELARFYRLAERTLALRIPHGSALDGKTLAETHFASLMGVHVTGIERDGRERPVIGPDEELRAGDVLLAQGRIEVLEDLLRFKGLRVSALDPLVLAALNAEVVVTTAELIDESLVGQSLKNLGFRERFGAVVFAVERGGRVMYQHVGKLKLQKRDLLLVLGRPSAIEKMKQDRAYFVADQDFSLAAGVLDKLFVVETPPASRLGGLSIAESRMGELLGVRALGVVRGKQTLVSLGGKQIIQPGDKLLVVGEAEQVDLLGQLANLEVAETEVEIEVESPQVGVVEAVLAPRSGLLGRTLIDARFRERYGFQVLAIWRGGRPWRSLLGDMPLQFGDSLLLQGPRAKIPLLADESDFVVLTESLTSLRRTHKASYAIFGLLLLIALSALRLQPVDVAAFTGAVFVVLTGALTMEEAYREVNWRVVFLVAALIPLGTAFEHSGAAALVAQWALELLGGWGPLAVLSVLALLSSLLSQLLDGSPAVVLLAPIALRLAEQLHVRPQPFLMAIAVAASICFLTPFSHKANLLVMAAGGYRVGDYLLLGVLTSLLSFGILVALVPVFFPF